jgi:hypothetical protein
MAALAVAEEPTDEPASCSEGNSRACPQRGGLIARRLRRRQQTYSRVVPSQPATVEPAGSAEAVAALAVAEEATDEPAGCVGGRDRETGKT